MLCTYMTDDIRIDKAYVRTSCNKEKVYKTSVTPQYSQVIVQGNGA